MDIKCIKTLLLLVHVIPPQPSNFYIHVRHMTDTRTLKCCIAFSSHSYSMLSFQLSHSLAFDNTSYNTLLLSSGLYVCQCTHSTQSEYYRDVEQMLLWPCASYAQYHLSTHSNRRDIFHNRMVSNQSSLSSQEEDHLPSLSTRWREHGSVRRSVEPTIFLQIFLVQIWTSLLLC